MTKLNGIIAVEKDYKNAAHKKRTEINHLVQKGDLFNGLYRTYQPLDENGENFPPERKHVQYKVQELLKLNEKAHIPLVDVTFQKDEANMHAHADLVVNGQVIFAKVPVTTLLFLEKHLTDYRTLISNLPVLDTAEEWEEDKTDAHLWRAAPNKVHKTKKVQKGLVLHAPTKEHPAQTAIIAEDITVGHWNVEKVSGAIQKKVKEHMLERIDSLLHATKLAREKANDREVAPKPMFGDAIYGFLNS